MPRWFELIEPVSDGVTAATSDAMRKQVGELGPEAFGEALPEGLPEGFDPREMVEQWAPMLGNLSRQMFSAQLGQAVGTLATEVVSGTEVGLPLTEPGVVALLPGNVAQLAESLEIDVRAGAPLPRPCARPRGSGSSPRCRGSGRSCCRRSSDYARNITIDTEAIESALSTIDPSDPEALRSALQGNLFRPQPTPAQRAALDRLETLLALAEGWVDHVTDRTTAQHLPQSAALAETIRRRRVGGAAQKTFAGLVGLELRPRRLRDAANLWAALESAGGADPARRPLGPPRPRAHLGRPRRPHRLRRARHRRRCCRVRRAPRRPSVPGSATTSTPCCRASSRRPTASEARRPARRSTTTAPTATTSSQAATADAGPTR